MFILFIKGDYTWQNLKLDTSNIPSFVIPSALYEIILNVYFKKTSKKDQISKTTLLLEIK